MDQSCRGVSQAVPNGNLTAILVGGFIAGAIDISYAIIVNLPRVAPARVLQSVASGLLGRAAYEGGAPTAWLGLFLHFAMAARDGRDLRRRRPLAAAGAPASDRRRHRLRRLIYFVMRWVVVPLSRFPGRPAHRQPARDRRPRLRRRPRHRPRHPPIRQSLEAVQENRL